MTDREGAFLFETVSPGTYRLTATHSVYLDGASSPPLLKIQSGRTITADIVLARGSAITGRVLSESGEPLFDVQVTAWRLERRAGRSTLSRAKALEFSTNDIGQYRIARLPAGEYLIAATAGTASNTDDASTTTWYPGTIDVGAAIPIGVQAGTDVSGVDIAYQDQLATSVSGAVFLPDGTPAGDGIVRLIATDGAEAIQRSRWFARIRDRGRFAVSRVPRGVYTLSVESLDATGIPHFYISPLTVQRNIVDLIVSVSPAARVQGRIAQAYAFATGGLSVVGLPLRTHFANSVYAVPVGSDGGFDLPLPPGQWTLAVRGLPALAAVNAVHVAATDARSGIEVGRADIRDVRIVIEPFGAALTGTVISGSPGENPVAVTMSDHPIRHPDAIAGIVVTRVTDGRFAVQNLLAGDYSIAVADLPDVNRLHDPNVRRELRARATSVRLSKGTTLGVRLPLLGPPVF